MIIHRILLTTACIVAWAGVHPAAATDLPIKIAEIKRDKPVDFAGEIYPLLKRNCLACHHAKEAEGGLNLESYEGMLKGGDTGAAVVAKDVAKSLILARASGSEDPLMPPDDNTVGAKPLTPDELGLLQLWIQQGAPGGEVEAAPPIAWQPIPESVRTIYALATSPDGRVAAVGRGNRAAIYDLATAAEVGRLVDPSIESMSGPGAAAVDMIQSIAFSPDGKLIATGGFRSVRLWRKVTPAVPDDATPASVAAGLVATNQDATQIALVNAIGDIEIWDTANKTRLKTLTGHAELITGLAWSPAADRLFSCDASGNIIIWQPSTGNKLIEHNLGTSLRELVASQDGTAIAAIDAERHVRFLRVTQATVENQPDAKSTNVQAADLEAVKPIADATAVAFASKPAPLLIVASETAGVMLVGLGDGKQIRKIDHGSPVDALAVSHDAAQLATGGRDGKTKLWKTENGEAIRTLEGDPESRIRMAGANRDVARQKAAVTRLEARTAELEKALTTENEAAEKVKGERDKATEKVAEEEKKRVEAVAKVTATESTMTKTTTDMKTAEAKVVETQKKTTEQEAMKKAIAEQVAKAKEARDKAAALLAAEEQKYKDVVAKMAAVDAALAKSKTEVETSTKMVADAKTQLEKLTKQLEEEKKAAAAAEEAKKKSDADLAKREQALTAATQAQQRATAAVPEHKTVVEGEKRRSALLQQRLVSITNRSAAPENAVVAMTFGRGNQVATAHAGGSIRTYAADGLPVASFTDQAILQTQTHGVAFLSADQICSFGAGRSSATWSLGATWKLERTIGSPNESPISDRVTALDFRRDGLSLAVGSGPPSRYGDVKVFAVGSGQLVRDFGEVHSDTVLGLRFSPDGRTLASSSADKTIRLLNLTDGSLIRSLEGHTHHVLSIAWQDDGQTIASASADQNLKVWNIETGQQRRTIGGFPKEITAIAFVQQSSQVVTACADGQLRLHDTSNGKSIRTFNAAGDFLFALGVTDDGKTLLGGGQNGILRVFNLADGKQLHEVK